VDQVAAEVAGAGFDALWLDRFGYGAELAGVEAVLGSPMLVSTNGRLAIFDLRPVARSVEDRVGVAEVERRAARLLEPVTLAYGSGFHGIETDGERRFAWSPGDSELELRNPTGAARRVRIAFVVASAVDGSWSLFVDWPEGTDRIDLSAAGTTVEREVVVPPGGLRVRLRTDAPELQTTDPRQIRFRVFDPEVLPPEGSPET
jgi:hypothetical protein